MPTFPGTVSPCAWHDGSQAAFTDFAGAVPAAVGDRVRRLNEASPLTGNWQPPTDSERTYRSAASLRYECFGPAGGYRMVRSSAPGGLNANAFTMVATYVARDNAFGGPQMGLFESQDAKIGIRIGGQNIWGFAGGAAWFSTIPVVHGKLNTIGVRASGSTVDVWLDVPGNSRVTQSLTVSLASTLVGAPLAVGLDAASYLYGEGSQFFVVPRACTDPELDGCMLWAAAQPIAVAYPDDRALIKTVGDSIPRGSNADYSQAWPQAIIPLIRAAGLPSEGCNVSVPGTGVTRIVDPARPSFNQDLLFRALDFHSPTRVHDVTILAVSTNDLANGNSPNYILFGTAGGGNEGLTPPAGSGLIPAATLARASGEKVVIVAPGTRVASGGVLQSTHDANRQTVCNYLAANWRSVADGFVDLRPIAHVGADGDYTNLTYFASDNIHWLDAAHALVAPVVATEVIRVLTLAIPSKQLSIERVLDWEADPNVYLFSLKNSA